MALGNRLIEYSVVLIPTIRIVKFTIRFSTNIIAYHSIEMLTSIVVGVEQSNLLADRVLCFFPPPYKISPRWSCSLQCLEAYPNNPTIVGLRSLCYSAGCLSSKLPEQICNYITNVYLQHSAGCGQDSAGCIATYLSAC